MKPLWPIARFFFLASLALPFGASTPLPAAETSQNTESHVESAAAFGARTKTNYLEARTRYLTDTNNVEAAWKYARACFDLAEISTNNTEKAEIAEKGIAASRQLIARQPKLAEAHYYLGMNVGELADTKRNLAALKMVKEMEHEFQTTADLNKLLDYAGPDRNLGLLYWEAPNLISIGSRSKARQHLRRAVELAPDYPENRLNLIEAYLKWGERSDATRELDALEILWPEAKKKFIGDAWAASWPGWVKRLKAAKAKLPDAKK